MVKVTFTLDDETVQAIRQTAKRLRKPQSQVVRDAVKQYAPQDRLSDAERLARVRTFEELIAKIPGRPAKEIASEIRDVRRSRRRSSLSRWRRQRKV